MNLIHYSPDRKIEWDLQRSYMQRNGADHKPTGLWFSDEDSEGWTDWCRAENFRLKDLKYSYPIKIDSRANILMLQTVWDLDQFHSSFNTPIEEGLSFIGIDWKRVIEQWQGIIITPYQWSRRLSFDGGYMWYYSWDCASGCIWDLSAISISAKGKTTKKTIGV